jgi:hypothetical protein
MTSFVRRIALLASVTLLTAPLVYAGIADMDLTGATRASPPTMGALEVGSVESGLPIAPTGIVLTRLVP